jgi:glycine/D-amino acid oxidase-like deaminating enzyme
LSSNYPYLSDSIRQVLHVEHAGSTDVHALGSLLLQRARACGTELIKAGVAAIQRRSSGGFELDLWRGNTSERLRVDRVILAAGPFTGDLAGMLGFRLPVENFLQRKIVIPDPLGILPRDIPFTVFADAQCLAWSDEERDLIVADPDYHWLLDEFPPGLHIKPDLPGRIKLGWAYNRTAERPRWEHEADLDFPNVVIRGASRFIPGLKQYIDKLPTPVVQLAGYYSRTPENWPLIGPLDSQGAFTISALSGYGTMAACAAGALCAAWVTGSTLPGYARHFHPDRYSDPEVVAEMKQAVSDGQL